MKRLVHIDWMRGLACALMFQTHCYDSWLSPEARKSAVYTWSQLLGTLPAPLFLFLSGVSFALVTQRLREKGAPPGEIAKTTLRRGAEIFGLGLLFRVQEYALGFGWAPWTDLFRVDVLNILGLSMMLMGVLCWLTASRGKAGAAYIPANSGTKEAIASSRNRGISASLVAAGLVALATPLLWTSYRPKFFPWPIESYINGVHNLGKPQPWLFPIFPWSAFAFVGLAIGFLFFTNLAHRKESIFYISIGGAGIAACLLSGVFDASHIQLYAEYDYWHTSPNFFLMRCGILLLILFLAYAWCAWGPAQTGFSPLIQLGKTSLIVYWVHIEFVYGSFSILPRHRCSVLAASCGLAAIFISMVLLSLIRTNWKNRADAKKRTSAPSAALGAA